MEINFRGLLRKRKWAGGYVYEFTVPASLVEKNKLKALKSYMVSIKSLSRKEVNSR